MKFALLQLNYTVGDLEGNAGRIAAAFESLKPGAADLVLASELALLGYPPRDMLLNRGFISRAWTALEELARRTAGGPALLVGVAEVNDSGTGRPYFNSAALLQDGQIVTTYRKSLLPTYDVFDEDRYFEPWPQVNILELNGRRIGVTICEDIWNDKDFWETQHYHRDPVAELCNAGVDYVVNISGSPFTIGKQATREAMLQSLSSKYRVPVVYVNQVGGNDDLVFDGRSSVYGADGRLLARAKAFQESVLVVDLDFGNAMLRPEAMTAEEEAWEALVLGTRDYLRKTGFQSALLGLSGGIDSALTAVVAAEAMGRDNVIGVLMPSPYSSEGSVVDSLKLAENLGIRTLTLPIQGIMSAFDLALRDAFAGRGYDVTEENIQSRIRGNLLMALSNKYGALLLTTGNKSELAVGYCTIYGDMAGGLGVIADVPKTMVYRISEWVNASKGRPIPCEILEKAPSAELRAGQKDQDSLPPYDILDRVLYEMVDLHKPKEDLTQSFDPMIVEKVFSLVSRAEFKRKQAPPGIKITDRAFGTGWRMPIACKRVS